MIGYMSQASKRLAQFVVHAFLKELEGSHGIL